MQITKTVKIVGAAALAAGIALGVVAGYAIDNAPDDAEAMEAIGVALHPGVEYAVLNVTGMT